jgi:hypothetical protein
LVLNADANHNNREPQTKEKYLDSYMAKNLYWFNCPISSKFNAESRYRNNQETYVSLLPVGYIQSGTQKSATVASQPGVVSVSKDKVIVNDPAYFWQEP